MSRATTIPTLGVGEQGCAGCFSLLVVLIAPEETVVPTVDVWRPPFTVAVVRDDEA
jgi:L-cystine uptake protein TcyP (sodium:dicarboxylate symporter family)